MQNNEENLPQNQVYGIVAAFDVIFQPQAFLHKDCKLFSPKKIGKNVILHALVMNIIVEKTRCVSRQKCFGVHITVLARDLVSAQ